MNKTIQRIAREHLNIQSLEPTGNDSQDFKEVGLASLKDALEAAYKAGQASTRAPGKRPTPTKAMHTGTADTFTINNIEHRSPSIGGAWVSGVCDGHAFTALVFRDHAEKEGTELGLTRITKITLTRIKDGAQVYSWDHGVEMECANREASQTRATIAGDLANRVFNHGK
jgi:hypothetical protein